MRFLLFPLLFAIVAILLAILLAVPPWAEEAQAIAEEDYVASQPQRADHRGSGASVLSIRKAEHRGCLVRDLERLKLEQLECDLLGEHIVIDGKSALGQEA
jgi:hypothetical protein